MATPAERKALLFFSLVAVLGAAVRLWRAHHARPEHARHGYVGRETSAADDDIPQAEADADIAAPPRRARRRPAARGAGAARSSGRATGRSSTADGRTASRSRTPPPDRHSSVTVDLDRATVAQIDALGVLSPGAAHLIVADRDSFGPFGSLRELQRVEFLTTGDIRKLAPRVTFSRVPRPRNTVIQLRSQSASGSGGRRVRRQRAR